MITTAIINLGYASISSLIGLLPAGSGFSSTVHSAVISLGSYLSILDPLIPISTLATVVSLVFSVEIAIFGFKTLRWILSYLPFIGGK